MVLGDLGQPLLLLRLGAEGLQRLGQTDRLVRGEQRRDRGVPGAGQAERLVVVDLREAEAAVLLGDLHPERAEVLEALDDVVGDLRVVLDLLRVDPLGQERAEALEELLALADALSVDLGLGMDEAEVEVTEVHPAPEGRLLPLRLAAGFSDLLGLFV